MELTPHRATCKHNQNEDDFCVLCQVENILTEIHSPNNNKNNAFAPVRFIDGFTSVVAPWFKKGLQEDSHEFLRLLTDGMQKSVLGSSSATSSSTKQNNSYAFQLFRGQVQSTVTCFACHETSTTIDPMEDLGLECVALSSSYDNNNNLTSKNSSFEQQQPSHHTLGTIQHSLDKFIQEEALDCYKCEKCFSLGKATKRSKIFEIPPILTLHLKRFRYGYAPSGATTTTNSAAISTAGTTLPATSSSLVNNNNSNTSTNNNPSNTGTSNNNTTVFTTLGRTGSNKIEGHIKFDELFDLKPYLTENWGYYWDASAAAAAKEKGTPNTNKKEGAPCFCRLFAVVVHTGANSHSGHYYALVRNLKKNEWWKMDDGNAIRISANEVANAHAYMLFYRVVEHPVSIQLRDDVVLRRRQQQQQQQQQLLLSKKVSSSIPNGGHLSSSSSSTFTVVNPTTTTKEDTAESQEAVKEIIVPLEQTQQQQQQQEEVSSIQKSKLQPTNNTTDTLTVADEASSTTGTDKVVPQEGANAVPTNNNINTNNNNKNNISSSSSTTTVNNKKKRPLLEDWEVKWKKQFKTTITSSIVPTLKQVQMWISEKVEFKAEYFQTLIEDSKRIENTNNVGGDTTTTTSTDNVSVGDENVKEEGTYCVKILKGTIRYLLYKQQTSSGTTVDSILLPAAPNNKTDNNLSSIPDNDSSSNSIPIDEKDCTMTASAVESVVVGVATEA